MDVERSQDGRWHFALGPVERWIVFAAASFISFVLYKGWDSITTRQDTQNTAMIALAQQQAVTNAQITQLQSQLIDVPALNQRVSKNEVRVDALEESTRELRGMKGLK